MTYNRIATPRAYMDRLSNDLATGFRTISNYTVVQDDKSTAVTFDGGQIDDLFDLGYFWCLLFDSGTYGPWYYVY